MLFVIPTFVITVKNKFGGEEEVWRVPETNIKDFIEVLLFNKCEFNVELEKDSSGRYAVQYQIGDIRGTHAE